MKDTISLKEMRERVAKTLFGDDWIGPLPQEECDLLKAHGPSARSIVRLDGSTVRLDHVNKCPPKQAAKLDAAIGRQARMQAQYVTVDSWIQDHGFSFDPRHAADRKDFNRALRKFQQNGQSAQPARRRGPKASVGPKIVAAMVDDIQQGRTTLVELGTLREKQLEGRYGKYNRETLRKARDEVLKNN
jgi:hypothetical protein